jgi:hypothetical protein
MSAPLVETACVITGPDSWHSDIKWNYEVRPGVGAQLGSIAVEATTSLPQDRYSLYAARLRYIKAIAEAGMAEDFAAMGLAVEFSSNESGREIRRASFASGHTLEEIGRIQSAANPDHWPVRPRTDSRVYFTELEGLTAVRDGFVLVSDSLERLNEYPTYYVGENTPTSIHDAIFHIPAWKAAVPVIGEIRVAMGRWVAEYEAAVASGDEKRIEAATKAVNYAYNKLEDGLNVKTLAGSLESNLNPYIGNYIFKAIHGEFAPENRAAAWAYERKIQDYIKSRKSKVTT